MKEIKIRRGDKCAGCGQDLDFVTVSYADEKLTLKLFCSMRTCLFYVGERIVVRDLKKERIVDYAQDVPRPEANRIFQKDLRGKKEKETKEFKAV